MKKDRIILYGAGDYCKKLLNGLDFSNVNIVGIVDKDVNKHGTKLYGYCIESIDKINDYSFDYFCICIANENIVESVRNLFVKKGIPLNKEILYDEIFYKIIENTEEKSDICESPLNWNVVFDCPNGLILGGVEAWSIDLSSALNSFNFYHTYILAPKICNENYKAENVVYYDIPNVSIWYKVHIISEAIENIMPCVIVLCHVNDTAKTAIYLKKKYPNKIRIISVVHNDIDLNYRNNLMIDKHVDIFITVSKKIKNKLVMSGINSDKAFLMTCPFECENKLERTYTDDGCEPIKIGYAGRIDGFKKSQKRMDILFNLLIELKKNKVNYHCSIAGDGVARTELENLVKDSSLDTFVEFLGMVPRENIKSFWKKQDICVNMSDYEGRSISIIEAMGNGAVPVVTDVSGVDDDIIDGENGFIVPLRDYVKAGKYIEYLSKNRHLLSIMGSKAHEEVYFKSQMSEHLKFWSNILNRL